MDFQFRSAFNGFNRNDVVSFLQNTTENHRNELLAVRGDLDRCKETIAQLTAENESLRVQLKDLIRQQTEVVEPTMQQRELEAYRRAVELSQAAEDKANAVTAAAEERAAALNAEVDARVGAAESRAAAIEEDARNRAAALEEEAQTRAAAVEEEAQTRAAAVTAEAEARVGQAEETLNTLIGTAADQFTGGEINDLIAAASKDLDALQERLRTMTDCFRQAAESIRGLQK